MHTSNYQWEPDPCIPNDIQVGGRQCSVQIHPRHWHSRCGSGQWSWRSKNTNFVKACNHFKIQQRQTESHTPRQNRAEAVIGEVKKQWRNKMHSKGVPKRLWVYGLVWASEINNWMPRGPEARTPLEAIISNTPDNSEWLDFDFYDWCWFWQGPTHELMESKAEIGMVLGVVHQIGSDPMLLDLNRDRQGNC